MGHDAIRIELERPVEALHALFLVEAEAPVQAEIEPALCLRGRRPDLPRVGTEIEAVHYTGSRSSSSAETIPAKDEGIEIMKVFYVRFKLVDRRLSNLVHNDAGRTRRHPPASYRRRN